MEHNIQEDRRKAFIAAFLFLLLLLLFFFLVSLKEPDPPLVEKEIEVELDIPQGGSSGGSTKSKVQTNSQNQSAQDLAVQDESDVQVVKGDGNDQNTNQNNQNAEESWMNMDGNNGGQNGGNDGGENFGGGGGGGDDIGPGPGNNSARIRYGSPQDCIGDFNEEGKVYLIIWVNAEGKIIRAQNNAAKSTTGSQNLISLAITAVKNCVYYEKRPGTPDQKIVLSQPVTFRKR